MDAASEEAHGTGSDEILPLNPMALSNEEANLIDKGKLWIHLATNLNQHTQTYTI